MRQDLPDTKDAIPPNGGRCRMHPNMGGHVLGHLGLPDGLGQGDSGIHSPAPLSAPGHSSCVKPVPPLGALERSGGAGTGPQAPAALPGKSWIPPWRLARSWRGRAAGLQTSGMSSKSAWPCGQGGEGAPTPDSGFPWARPPLILGGAEFCGGAQGRGRPGGGCSPPVPPRKAGGEVNPQRTEEPQPEVAPS